MKLYVLGTRCIEDNYFDNCPVFIGSSVEKCENFIKNNLDFFEGYDSYDWFWFISIEYLDHDIFNSNDNEHNDYGIFKKYTKEGIEIIE